MNNQSNEERERNNKLTDAFLYNIGYEHVNNLCAEVDYYQTQYELSSSEQLDSWFYDYLKQHEKKEKYDRVIKKVKTISKRVAIILLVLGAVSITCAMSVEAFRIRFFNMLIDTNNKFTDARFKEYTNIDYLKELPSDWKNYFYPTFLPDGYTFESAIKVNSTKSITFANAEGEQLFFVQSEGTSDLQLDSENGKVIEADINGKEGLLIEKEGNNTVAWYTDNHTLYLNGDIDRSTLLQIQDSITKKITKKYFNKV